MKKDGVYIPFNKILFKERMGSKQVGFAIGQRYLKNKQGTGWICVQFYNGIVIVVKKVARGGLDYKYRIATKQDLKDIEKSI